MSEKINLSSVIYDVHSSLLDTYSRRAVIAFQLTALGNDTQKPGLTPQEQPGSIQDLSEEEVYLINEGRPDDYIMQHYYKPGPSLFYYLRSEAKQILRYFASV